MKVYKGTDKDMKCRGKQYEIGVEATEERAEICESGIHACEYPLDVFRFYEPGAGSRYFVGELGEVSENREPDKVVGKRLTLSAEIGIPGIAKAAVEYIKAHIETEKTELAHEDYSAATNTGDRSTATNTGNWSAATNTGNYSAATNTGYWSAATNTGDRSAAANTGNYSAAANTGNWSAATNTGNYSAATNTGYWSAATNTGNWSAAANTGDRSTATNTGYWSAATNTGNYSAAANTGNYSAAANTGNYSAATNTGYWSAATNTGDRSAAANTGNWSAAEVTGKESVAIALGIEGRAKGAAGCWLVLAEWKADESEEWHRVNVMSALVDGELIKANTWYQLIDGSFVEM